LPQTLDEMFISRIVTPTQIRADLHKVNESRGVIS